jgi:hypothetical protein
MELAVYQVDGDSVIMAAYLEGSMTGSKCVPVRVKEKEDEDEVAVCVVLITNDVCVHMLDHARNESDKRALDYATEENGCDAVPLATFLAALCALDPKCLLTCEDLMAMAKPMPEDYYYDYRGGSGSFVDYDDDGDGESDGDHSDDDGGDSESDDGNHSGDDYKEDRSSTEYQFARNTPLMQNVNGRCGSCDGKVVELKGLMFRRYCGVCGQVS